MLRNGEPVSHEWYVALPVAQALPSEQTGEAIKNIRFPALNICLACLSNPI